jgi:hypothetical protein
MAYAAPPLRLLMLVVDKKACDFSPFRIRMVNIHETSWLTS